MGISRKQALECFRSDDLVGIGMEADAVRRSLHPENVVGYAIEHRIDFPALMGGAAGDKNQGRICDEIATAVESGATSVRLTCAELGIEEIETMLRGIRLRTPLVWIEAISPGEVMAISARCGSTPRDILARLHAAGLSSIADDGINLQREGEIAVAEWVAVHHAAHNAGMQTVAALLFGAGETAEQRIDLLEAARQLQEETNGFAAFAPRAAETPGGRELDGVTAVERLKTLAIARMFLDTIENVQASGTPQGLKVLQMGLRFGANDVGAISLEPGTEEDVRRIIRDAGFRPAQREMGYRAMMTF
jgi:cyclic dehypoxanthinyl futalosine synthase